MASEFMKELQRRGMNADTAQAKVRAFLALGSWKTASRDR